MVFWNDNEYIGGYFWDVPVNQQSMAKDLS